MREGRTCGERPRGPSSTSMKTTCKEILLRQLKQHRCNRLPKVMPKSSFNCSCHSKFNFICLYIPQLWSEESARPWLYLDSKIVSIFLAGMMPTGFWRLMMTLMWLWRTFVTCCSRTMAHLIQSTLAAGSNPIPDKVTWVAVLVMTSNFSVEKKQTLKRTWHCFCRFEPGTTIIIHSDWVTIMIVTID